MRRSRAYRGFVRKGLLPAFDIASGLTLSSTLRFLEAHQWSDKNEIRRFQIRKLKELIVHAYGNVPFYRERFRKANFYPADIDEIEDLRHLPITSRDDVKLGAKGEMIAQSVKPQTLQALRSSGSTGSPVLVYTDSLSESWDWGSKLRGWSWAGYQIGDRFARLWGNLDVIGKSESPFERLRSLMLRQLFLPAFDLDDRKARHHIQKINQFKPTTLRGYVSSLRFMAEHIAKFGGLTHSPDSVILSGEVSSESDRNLIEESFECPAFDDYGGIEVRSIAHECEEHLGMHISADNVIVEFIDSSGDPVLPGEWGNIVVTPLHRFSMPLIRYRIGDLGRSIEGDCSCGRSLPRIDHIDGREADMIYTPAGRHLSVHFFTILLEHSEGVGSFRIVMKGDSELVIEIVPNINYSNIEGKVILARAQDYAGRDVVCRIETVSQIPQSKSGKRRLVVREHNGTEA